MAHAVIHALAIGPLRYNGLLEAQAFPYALSAGGGS
jgi:hypothetical protein